MSTLLPSSIRAGARVLVTGAPGTVVSVLAHAHDPADDDVYVRFDDGRTTTLFAWQLARMPVGRCLTCRVVVEVPVRCGSGCYCPEHAPEHLERCAS